MADNILLKGLTADVAAEADVFLDDDILVTAKADKSNPGGKRTTKMSDHYGMWALLQARAPPPGNASDYSHALITCCPCPSGVIA